MNCLICQKLSEFSKTCFNYDERNCIGSPGIVHWCKPRNHSAMIGLLSDSRSTQRVPEKRTDSTLDITLTNPDI